MNLTQFEQYANPVRVLAEKGAQMITALKDEVSANLGQHIHIESSTAHEVTISFYGLRILVRIEIVWSVDVTGSIGAYLLSYDKEPTETLQVAYPFDGLGNVDRSVTIGEFAAPFLAQVFTRLYQSGTCILRP